MVAALLSKEENTGLIFAGQILSELLNNDALISLHVAGLTSHASVFMQLQMFIIGFKSGDCGGNSILRLALFSNHANTVMALWQGELSCWNANGIAGPYAFALLTPANFHPWGQCKNTGWHFHQPLSKYQRKKADASPNHNRNVST